MHKVLLKQMLGKIFGRAEAEAYAEDCLPLTYSRSTDGISDVMPCADEYSRPFTTLRGCLHAKRQPQDHHGDSANQIHGCNHLKPPELYQPTDTARRLSTLGTHTGPEQRDVQRHPAERYQLRQCMHRQNLRVPPGTDKKELVTACCRGQVQRRNKNSRAWLPHDGFVIPRRRWADIGC